MQKTTAFIQNINAPEIVLIFLVILLFFGAKRMPDLARSVGKSMREFKQAKTTIEEDLRSAMDDEPVSAPSKSSTENKSA